jgi:hypothetical protein
VQGIAGTATEIVLADVLQVPPGVAAKDALLAEVVIDAPVVLIVVIPGQRLVDKVLALRIRRLVGVCIECL